MVRLLMCLVWGMAGGAQGAPVDDPLAHLEVARALWAGPLDDASRRLDAAARSAPSTPLLEVRREVARAEVLWRQGARAASVAALAAQGVVTDWQLIGPLPGSPGGCAPTASTELERRWAAGRPLPEEWPGLEGVVSWRGVQPAAVGGRLPVGELIYPEGAGVVLLRASLEAEGQVALRVGSTAPYRLWVDGHPLGRGPAGHRAGLDAYGWPLSLAAGRHEILVAMCPGARSAELVARLSTFDGAPVPARAPSAGPWAGLSPSPTAPAVIARPGASAEAAWLADPQGLPLALSRARWASLTGLGAQRAWRHWLSLEPSSAEGWAGLLESAPPSDAAGQRQALGAWSRAWQPPPSGELRWADVGATGRSPALAAALGIAPARPGARCGPGQIVCAVASEPPSIQSEIARALQTPEGEGGAVARLEEMKAWAGGRPELWAALGHAHRARGELKAAVEAWRRSLAMSPRQPELIALLRSHAAQHRERLCEVPVEDLLGDDPGAPTDGTTLVLDRQVLRLGLNGRPSGCRVLVARIGRHVEAPSLPSLHEDNTELRRLRFTADGVRAVWSDDALEPGDIVARLEWWSPTDRRPRPGRAFSALIEPAPGAARREVHIEAPMDLGLVVHRWDGTLVPSRLARDRRRWREVAEGPVGRPHLRLSTVATWAGVGRLRRPLEVAPHLDGLIATLRAEVGELAPEPRARAAARWLGARARCDGDAEVLAHPTPEEVLRGEPAGPWGCATALTRILARLGLKPELSATLERGGAHSRLARPAIWAALGPPVVRVAGVEIQGGTLEVAPGGEAQSGPYVSFPVGAPARVRVAEPAPAVEPIAVRLQWAVDQKGDTLLRWFGPTLNSSWPAREIIEARLRQLHPGARVLSSGLASIPAALDGAPPELALWPLPDEVRAMGPVQVSGEVSLPSGWSIELRRSGATAEGQPLILTGRGAHRAIRFQLAGDEKIKATLHPRPGEEVR